MTDNGKAPRGKKTAKNSPRASNERKIATKKSAKKKSSAKKKVVTKKTVTKKKTTQKSTAKNTPSKAKSTKKTGAKRSRKMNTSKTSLVRRVMPTLSILALVILCGLCIGLVIIDRDVTQKFEGRRWQLPAKVYSRPLELYVGKNLSINEFEIELQRLDYRSGALANDPGEYTRSQNQITLIRRSFSFPEQTEAEKSIQITFNNSGIQSIINTRSDESEGLVRLEPILIGGFYPSHKEDRVLVRLDDVPQQLIDLLLVTEDRQFFEHRGISFRGIARAFWINITNGEVKQGGSTITQQLVKNFYLSNERTLSRKLQELAMAGLLELHYSKQEILEAYLNEIYLGQQGEFGIHGFGLASQYYFDRPLGSINTEQMALLVALVKGASYYNPWKHSVRAKERRNQILTLLFNNKQLSQAELWQATAAPLSLPNNRQTSRFRYPAYIDLVRRQIAQDYAHDDLISEGLRIFTNLDPRVQANAERSLTQEIEGFENAGRVEKNQLQGAVVVVSPHSGEVVALVGDRQARFAGFNRAMDAKRPVGSILKPAIYLTAIESRQYTFDSIIQDRSISLDNEDGSVWTPENFNGQIEGDVTLQKSLAKSINLATANLGLELGIDKVVTILQQLGLDQSPQPLPSLLLGAVALTPVEVAQVYQTIAAGGFNAPLKSIQSVVNSSGEVLSRYAFKVEKRFEPESMFALQTAMQSVINQGTAKSAHQWISKELNAAGKTGTTDQQRDSWFAGYTGDYLAVTWLGRDDNQPTALTGGTGALPVWSKIMASSSKLPVKSRTPSTMAKVWIDGNTGLRSKKGCENAYLAALPKLRVPSRRAPCTRVNRVKEGTSIIKGWWDRLF